MDIVVRRRRVISIESAVYEQSETGPTQNQEMG